MTAARNLPDSDPPICVDCEEPIVGRRKNAKRCIRCAKAKRKRDAMWWRDNRELVMREAQVRAVRRAREERHARDHLVEIVGHDE